MNSFNPNFFIHACNVLMLVAYSVRDILWLRLFAVGASLIAMPYFVLQPKPLWAPLSWSALFAAINAYQSWRLFLERRPVKLTEEEEAVRKLALQDLPPRKIIQVLSIGSGVTSQSGEMLLQHGRPAEAISLIISGKVRITKGDQVMGELGAGDLVGSAMLLSGALPEADAMAVGPVRAMRWEIKTLERYLAANPETRIVMQRHLAHDLAGKIQHLAAGMVTSDPAAPPAAGGPSAPEPRA
jgi:CRP-like cAMP-binding protein